MFRPLKLLQPFIAPVASIGFLFLLIISIINPTYAGQELPEVLIEPFPILSWVPPAVNEEQLGWYKEAGFTVMTIYPDEETHRTMRLHWDGNYIVFREWTQRCPDTPDYSYEDMLAFKPDDVKKIGYLIADEPHYRHTKYSTHNKDLEEVIDIVEMMRKEDPQRISLVNLFPSFVGETNLGGSWLGYVRDYFEIMRPRYSSFDHYPLRWFDVTSPTFYYDLEIFRRYAMWNDSKMIGFVQIFSQASLFRDVSESDVAWQVNTFLAYGCKGLWYFNFRHPHPGLSRTPKPVVSDIGVRDFRYLPGPWSEYYKDAYTTFGPAILDYNDQPTRAFDYVRDINRQVAAWGPTLLRLNNIAVRHVVNRHPFVPVGTEQFVSGTEPYIRNVRAVDVDEDMGFIVSYFEDADRTPYTMIVNKRHGEYMTRAGSRTKTLIQFDDSVKNVSMICNKTGNELPIEHHNRNLRIDLDAGGAVLLKLHI